MIMFQRVAVLFVLAAGLSLFAPLAALALPPEEEAAVEALLDALSRETDVVFIRNGSEYTSAQAVSHLRRKLDNTRGRLSSAEQFIDKVASSSSMSGKPYLVRKPGRQEEQAGQYFRQLLKSIQPETGAES